VNERIDARDALAEARILVTRAPHQAAAWIAAIEARGAEAIASPVLRIEATADEVPALDAHDWVVITSPNGVQHLDERLKAEARPDWPSAVSLAVVGPATAAAARSRGWPVDLQPDQATGEALAARFGEIGIGSGTRVLRIRGDRAPRLIEATLGALGASVVSATLYRTVAVSPPPEALAALRTRAVDAVVFASGSAVASLLEATVGLDLPTWLPAACLGPVTADAARDVGFERVVTAADTTAEALVDALATVLARPG
jgi:uroporphyrinogen-III synthase